MGWYEGTTTNAFWNMHQQCFHSSGGFGKPVIEQSAEVQEDKTELVALAGQPATKASRPSNHMTLWN
jgi:hypothetical protein